MSIITETLITQLVIGGTILGVAYVQRSFIGMILKTTIELLVRDAIDREKQQKALIYEAQTVARAGGLNEIVVDNTKTIPAIIKIEDRLGNLENDFGVMLPLFNKELEYFKEEIEKILPPNCTEEQKEKCIEHFLEIKKMLNNDQD